MLHFRPMPQVDCTQLVDQISHAAQRHGVQVEFRKNCDPMWTDPHSDLVHQALEITGGQEPTTVSYATDGGVLSEIEHKIVFGPGDIAQAHTPQEYISLQQMQQGIDAYTRMIHRFCGGAAAKQIAG